MKIGLALSGGGTRGVAHLGVLKAIGEKGIRLSALSATSVGAIIAALHGYGYGHEEILQLFKSGFFKTVQPAFNRSGLLQLGRLHGELLKLMPVDRLEELSVPVIIAATNLNRGTVTYFSEGPLCKIICSSCSVPGIFSPVKVEGERYVDGGITDNLPVAPIRAACDFVIASHCNPIDNGFSRSGIKSIIERALLIAINGNARPSKAMADLVIEPPALGKFSASDISSAQDVFDISYEYAMAHLPATIASSPDRF